MNQPEPPWIPSDRLFDLLDYGDAVAAVQRALRGGLDPADDPARAVVEVVNGQLLLMPSEGAGFVGVKIATVAPANPAAGLERIQGTYLLIDATTLSPVAILDGAALTTLRTPAVSAAVADLLAPKRVGHLVVFGAGPQAWGHVQALRAIRRLDRVSVVTRHPDRARRLVDRLASSGLAARVGRQADVQDAQLVVCVTTSRVPVLDGRLVPDDCCVIAVGSHEPQARELDSALIRRSQLVVEDIATALREAGDVAVPIAEGWLAPDVLVPMRDILTGTVAVDLSRPRVFKSTGMSWEDLVVAVEVWRAANR